MPAAHSRPAMSTSCCAPRLDPAGRLHRALGALQRQRVPGALRAARQLEHFLAGYGPSEGDWARSPLTTDGFPCELTFGSAAPGVRYAVEPAAPARQRLAVCESLLEQAGAPAIAETVRHRMQALQQAGALSYGAWLGASHDAQGDRYKLYAEVPQAGAAQACASLLNDYLGHGGMHQGCALRMLGYDPAGGVLEFYFRSEAAVPAALTPWMADSPLAAWLADRPAQVCGFSIALGPEASVVACSHYLFANAALGSDAQLRRRVLGWSRRHGWRLPGYAAVSAPAAQAGSCQHGLLAVVSRGQGPCEIRLGLAPPRLQAHA